MHINTFGVLDEPYFSNQLQLFWYHLKLSFYCALAETSQPTLDDTMPNNTRNPLKRLQQQEDHGLQSAPDKNIKY